MNINSALKWSIQPISITLWLAIANLSFNLFHAFTIQGTGAAEAWYIRWDPMNLPTCLWIAALMLRIYKAYLIMHKISNQLPNSFAEIFPSAQGPTLDKHSGCSKPLMCLDLISNFAFFHLGLLISNL